jgi:YesN/AraC family two-component response regulator
LEKTNKSISEIGYGLGYTSPSYFASQFEKLTGNSPSDYRKER